VGFALWIDREVAWAEGRHEYRPMGTAVVAVSDLFRQRDFRPARKSVPRVVETYAGLFASIGEMNAYLKARRRSQTVKESSSPP
jgi:hypothetical protein